MKEFKIATITFFLIIITGFFCYVGYRYSYDDCEKRYKDTYENIIHKLRQDIHGLKVELKTKSEASSW